MFSKFPALSTVQICDTYVYIYIYIFEYRLIYVCIYIYVCKYTYLYDIKYSNIYIYMLSLSTCANICCTRVYIYTLIYVYFVKNVRTTPAFQVACALPGFVFVGG